MVGNMLMYDAQIEQNTTVDDLQCWETCSCMMHI